MKAIEETWRQADRWVFVRLAVLWARFPILGNDEFHRLTTGTLLILMMMFWGVPVLNAVLAGLFFVALFLGTANILEKPGG